MAVFTPPDGGKIFQKQLYFWYIIPIQLPTGFKLVFGVINSRYLILSS